jgi:Tol biopolymer transport system component
MRRRMMGLVLTAALSATTIVVAQQTRQADVELQAAIRTETVNGDLRAAIKQYESLTTKYARDRAFVANVLIRMANAYQKLGDTESQHIYERIVREFSDQGDSASIARGRLTSKTNGNQVSLRKIYTANIGDYAASVSPDGRYISHAGSFNTAVYLREVATGAERLLTDEKTHGTDRSAISRDGTQIAYDWYDAKGAEMRIAGIVGTGLPASRTVFRSEDAKITPMDWSPDGKLIAVFVRRSDGSAQLGLLNVQDGFLRILKSVDWRGPTQMFFSPDGADLAYDLPVSEEASQRDIFIISTNGSRELAAVAHPANDLLMGWSPNGALLLFASDRRGSMDLWSIAPSKAGDLPELLKSDIGFVESLGVTKSGALFMQSTNGSDSEVELVSIDLKSGSPISRPARLVQRANGINSEPAWSPDGKLLAYMSQRGRDERLIAIQNIATGEFKELTLRPQLPWFIGLSWSPDGKSIAVVGDDLKGRHGLFRVDAKSGAVSPLIAPISGDERLSYEGVSWSLDGQRIYYHSQNGTIRERNLITGDDRTLIKGQNRDWKTISLSPDGKWLASYISKTVMLIPVSGGEPTELFRVPADRWINNVALPWTPEGDAILIRVMFDSDGSKSELWSLPVNGDAPRKINVNTTGWLAYAPGKIRLNADGKTLAYVTGKTGGYEAWTLENVLPK